MSTDWNAALWQHDLSPWLNAEPSVRNVRADTPFVLVVDENIAQLLALVYLLNHHGLLACGARSVSEALVMLRRHDGSFRALVASTSVVRRGDGELVRACRSEFHNLPVIAVAESRGIEFAHKTDCFAYLERPFRLEQLLDLVREALRQAATERSIA